MTVRYTLFDSNTELPKLEDRHIIDLLFLSDSVSEAGMDAADLAELFRVDIKDIIEFFEPPVGMFSAPSLAEGWMHTLGLSQEDEEDAEQVLRMANANARTAKALGIGYTQASLMAVMAHEYYEETPEATPQDLGVDTVEAAKASLEFVNACNTITETWLARPHMKQPADNRPGA